MTPTKIRKTATAKLTIRGAIIRNTPAARVAIGSRGLAGSRCIRGYRSMRAISPAFGRTSPATARFVRQAIYTPSENRLRIERLQFARPPPRYEQRSMKGSSLNPFHESTPNIPDGLDLEPGPANGKRWGILSAAGHAIVERVRRCRFRCRSARRQRYVTCHRPDEPTRKARSRDLAR
jgi:hypothetical protein